MDVRELLDDPEEAFRVAWAGLQKGIWTIMPARIVQDTKDGHTATAQPTIKREVIDPETGLTSYEDHVLHPDVPIAHIGGGNVATTYPNKTGDEGLLLYAARSIGAWFQSGGTQQPMDASLHSIGEASFLSGIRSVPRKLQQVDQNAAQIRSDDKHHVLSHDPAAGTTIRSVDPSTAPATVSFDPFKQATTYLQHAILGAVGISHDAVRDGVAHSYALTHDAGHALSVLNGLHKMVAHPDLGALLSAADGQHMVQAHPEAGVKLSSSAGIVLDTPNLSLPPGSIKGEALDPNAVGDAIGTLGGDLAGSLPSPQVVSIAHVMGADKLPNCANDAAAAARIPPVPVGGLYRNGSTLCVRVT